MYRWEERYGDADTQREREIERDGEMERWRDGEMERWMKVIGGAKLISVVYRDIDVEGRAEMWILYKYIGE